ncbi:hypothetical protein U9M48_004237 [Paspalum notatum var. saurae]|uniref:Uncharacterized protein n=1 Tax=Paspalum notatum var. saurae TaxID=547442 RepID=A0AAQ3PV67_PASNO
MLRASPLQRPSAACPRHTLPGLRAATPAPGRPSSPPTWPGGRNPRRESRRAQSPPPAIRLQFPGHRRRRSSWTLYLNPRRPLSHIALTHHPLPPLTVATAVLLLLPALPATVVPATAAALLSPSIARHCGHLPSLLLPAGDAHIASTSVNQRLRKRCGNPVTQQDKLQRRLITVPGGGSLNQMRSSLP